MRLKRNARGPSTCEHRSLSMPITSKSRSLEGFTRGACIALLEFATKRGRRQEAGGEAAALDCRGCSLNRLVSAKKKWFCKHRDVKRESGCTSQTNDIPTYMYLDIVRVLDLWCSQYAPARASHYTRLLMVCVSKACGLSRRGGLCMLYGYSRSSDIDV